MTPGNMQGSSPLAKSGESAPPAELGETAFVGSDTPVIDRPPASGSGTAQTWIGKVLGKYQVTGVLAQGGMGVVLKAHDPMIERDVAIKILADHLTADASALSRFLAEARAAGKLNHPNVIAIYEIGQQGQTYYLVLEYVPGGNLGDRLAGGPSLSVPEATQALIDASKGVGAAHAVGVIHRDIKPTNLMWAADGSIKVADFGLAKAADAGRHLTQTGVVVGTPFYMSPEQCEAKPLDHRGDLYSLGATYYCLLTGKDPYHETDSLTQLMYMHCHGPIPDPRSLNPTVPEACSRIVARAMAKAPDDRYQSTGEMLADLQAMVATLSRLTRIVLPSESGTVPATRAAASSAPVPTLSFSVGDQQLSSLNLADLEGDYASWTYFQSVTTPENEEYVRRFHEKYPQRSITDPMATVYMGVKLWAQAVNEAQSLDPKKIRRALLNQRLKGPGGEVRIDPDTQYCYRTPHIGQIQADGQFKVVWTAPEPVRPEP
jgi:serine/threonine protein kinase